MRSDLFTIPLEVGGVPLFGLGIMLIVWLLFSAGLLVVLTRKQGWNSEVASYLPVLGLLGLVIFFLPKLFSEGLPIRGYGVMVLCGSLSGLAMATSRAKKMGIHPDRIYSLAFWMFFSGIFGARLFFCVEYYDRIQGNTFGETLRKMLMYNTGGLVVYGALVGSGLVFVFFMKRYKLPMLAVADMIVPSLMIGLAFGRIGCLLHGCCFGGLCDTSLGITFPQGSVPYELQVYRGEMHGVRLAKNENGKPAIAWLDPQGPLATTDLKVGDEITRMNRFAVKSLAETQKFFVQSFVTRRAIELRTESGKVGLLPAVAITARSLPIHPTQIYSAINAALVGWFLWAVYPFRRRDGQITALFLTLYPIGRFLLEAIRIDEAAVFGTGLSISQNISLVMLIGVIGLWVYTIKSNRPLALPLKKI